MTLPGSASPWKQAAGSGGKLKTSGIKKLVRCKHGNALLQPPHRGCSRDQREVKTEGLSRDSLSHPAWALTPPAGILLRILWSTAHTHGTANT